MMINIFNSIVLNLFEYWYNDIGLNVEIDFKRFQLNDTVFLKL